MSMKAQLELLNRQYTADLKARADAIAADPAAKKRLDDAQAEAMKAHQRKRPLRRRAQPGERFRYPSRSEGARELRRRAQHWAQSLPWDCRVNYELTDTQVIVLALHYRLADARGAWEPSVTEIANRSKISYRAVQLANRRLAALGLISIEERPDEPFRHQTNVYRLSQNLMKSRKGAKSCAPKVESLTPPSTEINDFEKNKGAIPNASPTPQTSELDSKHASRWAWVATFGRQHSAPSETEINLARAANRMLDGEQPSRATEVQLWQRGSELIERYAPRIYGSLVAQGIRSHGFKALLAIYELALLSEVNHVESGHGYLWGTLRKSSEDCRPHLTLSRLFAARAVPGFKVADKVARRIEAGLEQRSASRDRDRVRRYRAGGYAAGAA